MPPWCVNMRLAACCPACPSACTTSSAVRPSARAALATDANVPMRPGLWKPSSSCGSLPTHRFTRAAVSMPIAMALISSAPERRPRCWAIASAELNVTDPLWPPGPMSSSSNACTAVALIMAAVGAENASGVHHTDTRPGASIACAVARRRSDHGSAAPNTPTPIVSSTSSLTCSTMGRGRSSKRLAAMYAARAWV